MSPSHIASDGVVHSLRVVERFRSLTDVGPLLVRSPGRVNLIGEHTDYNEGFVLPAAIDRAITFALGPRNDAKCVFVAADLDQSVEIELATLAHDPRGWPDYLTGILDQMQKAGVKVQGVTCVFGGDIPVGAGLSSSAAIGAGFAFGLNVLFGGGMDRRELALLAQRSENEFVGVQCGIMDQYINLFGETDSVLRIDCRSLRHDIIPVKGDVAILLANTEISHSLAASEYNTRRTECAEGVKTIKRHYPHIQSLRDVTTDMLEDVQGDVPAKIFSRCAYVVNEHDRLITGCEDLVRGDLSAFGQKMFETHKGLRDDYEVSCPELDILVDTVQKAEGVYGGRMMGGGFGGCTINLVQPDAISDVQDMIQREFARSYGRVPPVYVASIREGTHVLPMHPTEVLHK